MPMLIREVNDGFSVWGDRVLGGLLAARPKGRTQAEALMRDGGLLDILIVGGGPAGLAAAIAAHKAEMNYQVLEKGTLVNSIFNFPSNMVFFTTPELLEIGGLPFTSPYQKPT